MTPLVTTIPQQVRGAGSTVIGPVAIPAGYTSAQVALNIATADYTNPITDVSIVFEWFDGSAWNRLGAMNFRGIAGGLLRNGVINPAPGLALALVPTMQQARATVTLAQTITAGMSITLT